MRFKTYNSLFEQELIESTIAHLDRNQHDFYDSLDRFLLASGHISSLGLHLSRSTTKRIASIAVAEFESRFTSIYLDLNQSTDCLLAIRNRITNELQYVPISTIQYSI